MNQGAVRQKMLIKVGLFLISFLLLNPILVSAKTCYVDDDVSSGGDGSSSKPYKTITEALDEECDKIKVKKGEYSEKVDLGDNVKLEGAGESTIIKGEVIMDNETSLEDVYVKDGGIEVKNKANVAIENVKITGADIGIVTKGDGKLTIYNCEIKNNRKGLYIQYGKDISIKNSEIIDNNEEGLDIRANVDGVVEDNTINGNKESGIEVIAGKSELIIRNNSLRNNRSSGIAVQFYKSTSVAGELKISGNTITGNSNYGIDCQNPSGGVIGFNYWSRSIQFGYNKVGENKKGNFSEKCQFSKEEIWQATKTESEIKRLQEEIKKRLEEGSASTGDDKTQDEDKEGEQEEGIMDESIEEAIKEVRRQQKDIDIKSRIEKTTKENYKKFEDENKNTNQQIQKYSKIKAFFIGPNKEILTTLKEQVFQCQLELRNTQKLLKEIETEKTKVQAQELLKSRQAQCEELSINHNAYQNKFGLLSWFKKTF